MSGQLILVATPIGNLGDLSIRAEEALRSADAIACEDTRHTLKLLSAKAIQGKRLLAVHEHNEVNAAAGIVSLIERGQTVALVTDAGTPGISDPGEVVVAAVANAGLTVSSVPGPSAVIVALTLSGLPTARFVFEGFLPTKNSARVQLIDDLATEHRTIVLYEAPHRMTALLAQLGAAWGTQRRIAICRELTKRFETVTRTTLGDATATIGEPQGEYVLVVEGAPRMNAVSSIESHDPDSLVNAVEALRERGQSMKAACTDVASELGLNRKQLYDFVVTRTKSNAPGTAR